MKKAVYPTIWNLTLLAKSDEDPELAKKRQSLEKISANFINKWKKRTDYLEDPQILKQALDEYESWRKIPGPGGDEELYFELRTSQDQNNPLLKAKLNQITDFSNKIYNQIQFFELNLAKISPQKQQEFLKSEILQPYHHFLEKLFAQSPYLLSDPEEKIMNLKSKVAHTNWVRLTQQFLSSEEREVLLEEGGKGKKSFSEIMSFISSKNKQVRDSAAAALNDILNKYLEVAEAEINSVLENKKIDDELRKLPRPDKSRHLHDDIDSEVVDTLVKTVAQRFNLAQRYYQLKAKLLGVKKLAYHERNVEYGETDFKYTYEEAIDLIIRVLNRLDPEFAKIALGFAANGLVDVYPHKGKRSGAFCAYNSLSQPTYVFLNFTSRLGDVLTIAHEFGHGVNAELMKPKQNALNYGTPMSTAEVASTFMEDFVLEEIRQKADDNLKLALMMMKLNDDISSIFRQIASYRFETEMHQTFRQKGFLSAEELGKIFQKHMESYMGEAVEQSPGAENWWEHWSHFRSFFYNYSYASGLLISKSLQSSVKKDPRFIAKVKEFLSAGTSDSPKNIFAKLGIDITDPKFWNQGMDEIENLLDETEKLATKLEKIT